MKSFRKFNEGKGLWANIDAKRKAGKEMRKAGEEGAPSDADLKRSKNEDNDPCWDTHKQIGTKKKNDKEVPNCVPKESADPATVRMYKDNPHMMKQKGPGGFKSLNRTSQKSVKKAVKSFSTDSGWKKPAPGKINPAAVAKSLAQRAAEKAKKMNEDKEFVPHMMYDPKTGKGYKAEVEADHLRMEKLGYTHNKPEVKEDNCGCGETPCKSKAKSDVTEAMNMAQRRKAAISFKRNKSKIKIGRERAKRRMASKEVLMKRARKAARMTIMKKLTKAGSKGDLDFARREAIEKRLDKMKSKIDQVAKKLYPELRKKEMTKRQKKND